MNEAFVPPIDSSPGRLTPIAPFAPGGAPCPEPARSWVPARAFITAVLDEDSTGRETLQLRLLLGAAGMLVLGVVAAPAMVQGLLLESRLRWLQPLTSPVAAALGLTLGLPGLFILMSIVGKGIPIRALWSRVARAYFALGAICGAIAPVLFLYAQSGASDQTIAAAYAFTYGTTGLWVLASLAWDLWRKVGDSSLRALLTISSWAFYTAILSAYLWVKLSFLIWK